ncbi:hypothetical protein F383_30817 [Gossypium arboreum]|nr:hypothetical protein F383_30817 [Gossypium arboreum]
MMPTSQTWSYT